MSIPLARSHIKPLKLLAGAAAASLIIGGAVGAGAQTPAPPAPQQQAQAPQPLGQDDVREVQNQLIALGYNPGPADGQIGPATTMAVQQYDASHGGNGQAPIDGALLARLKADKGPRLTYEQVAQRSQAQASAPASGGASAIGGILQTLAPIVGAAIANSNNNYYGPGYYEPGYYRPPPPVYYGYGYGGY